MATTDDTKDDTQTSESEGAAKAAVDATVETSADEAKAAAADAVVAKAEAAADAAKADVAAVADTTAISEAVASSAVETTKPAPPIDHGPADLVNPVGDGPLYGLLAEFKSPGALKHAAKRVRDAGYSDFDCYSPFAVHGIDDAMGIKRTKLPLIIFAGGFAGLVGGVFLQWWMNAYNWPLNIAGKPSWSIPANIPIIFEATILLSVLSAFFGMWAANKLPRFWHPFFRLDRFAKVTDDGFMLGIEAKDGQFDLAKTTKLLLEAGALEVEACYLDPDPEQKKMPKWIMAIIACTTVMALVPFALIAKARVSKSTQPHYHIFSDMDFQPKVKSDSKFNFFADDRGNRGEVPGTVARGHLNADDLFYRGIEGNQWTERFPAQLVVNEAMMNRGQERYNIYCAACHGYDGSGNGTIRKRSEQLGTPLLVANIVESVAKRPLLPNGQLFNVISNGAATMAGYAAQIPHADRWAIVLYLRALQRAHNASSSDAGNR